VRSVDHQHLIGPTHNRMVDDGEGHAAGGWPASMSDPVAQVPMCPALGLRLTAVPQGRGRAFRKINATSATDRKEKQREEKDRRD
jgi:hypothetical protein